MYDGNVSHAGPLHVNFLLSAGAAWLAKGFDASPNVWAKLTRAERYLMMHCWNLPV